jgi:FKBP-type peptidyl-prolyl cis-trans isomerase
MESIMRSFLFALLFTSFVWGGDLVKDFSQDLSKEQRNLLSDFLMAVVDAPGGYVLYGDKPMSVESYDISSLQALTNPDPRTVALVKGRELWEDLKLNLDKKDYLITTFELEKKLHVVCINRNAFTNVVQENLTLFRYVLGPALTADALIHQLMTAGPHFFSVLKNDQTLIGMLLGNGKQNSLLYARLMNITDPNSFGKTEEFPLVSKKLSRAWAASSRKFQKEPSFGFSSLDEEEFKLNRVAVESIKLKPFANCQLPRFECDPELEETRSLLSTYEQNRNRIMKTVASKTFLDDTLRRLFANADGMIDVPQVPKQRDLCLPVSREETARKVVELIHKKIAQEPLGVKKFQNAFLQGVAAREKGKQLPYPNQFKRSNDLATVQKEIEACKNLELATAYFEKLSTREDLVALIPQEIYYKILKPGKEGSASTKTSQVSFQYSFQILGDPDSKDWGVVKQEQLGALIPGIAHAIVGMQQGEERVVYIHPKHAYGEDSFFPPNVSIVAQIRLLDWKEGEQPVAVLPPHQLEQRDYKDLLAKFEVLRSEEFFDEGVSFWDAIKKSGDFIDFQTFQKIYLSNDEGQTSFQNASQEEKFMVDLEYHLLSLQKRN